MEMYVYSMEEKIQMDVLKHVLMDNGEPSVMMIGVSKMPL